MFCPQCKAEYRDGFSRCTDCDIDLVAKLPIDPPEPEPIAADEHLRIVYTTHEQNDCVAFCRRLMEEGISFKVAESNRQYFKDVKRTFAIGVPGKCFKKAQEIRSESCLDWDEAPESDE
jgi:hypothetical protein